MPGSRLVLARNAKKKQIPFAKTGVLNAVKEEMALFLKPTI
jgi:hypothetical protein